MLPMPALAQLAAPPAAPSSRLVTDPVPAIRWACKLVDKAGRVFPIAGTTPAFDQPDTHAVNKPMAITSPDRVAGGVQKVALVYGGDPASFDVSLRASTEAVSYSMTLFLDGAGSGMATVHTRALATRASGFYASGLCQSNYHGK